MAGCQDKDKDNGLLHEDALKPFSDEHIQHVPYIEEQTMSHLGSDVKCTAYCCPIMVSPGKCISFWQ